MSSRGPARRKHRLAPVELARSLASDVMHLAIVPIEACNFRCTYCYESYEYGRRAPEVVAGVKHVLTPHAPELSWLEPEGARRV